MLHQTASPNIDEGHGSQSHLIDDIVAGKDDGRAWLMRSEDHASSDA
jgi:hypothetical protein